MGVDFRCNAPVEFFELWDHHTFGDHVAIGTGVYCSAKLRVGNHVHIGPHTIIIGGVQSECVFEDFSWTSGGVKIACRGETPPALINPTIPEQYREMEGGRVVFERFSGAYLGAIILPGLTIGVGAIIGAGAVLTEDAEPWTIYAGNPARAIKNRDSREKCMQYARELGYVYE